MAAQPRAGSRVVAVLATTVLAVAVGALAVLALQRSGTAGPVGTATPAPTFTFGDRVTPTASPVAPSPAPSDASATERFLAVQGAQVWRATAGTCGSAEVAAIAPVVEHSTDGGASWSAATPPDTRRVLSLAVFGEGNVEVLAASGTECAPLALRSYTRELTWAAYPDAAAGSTFVPPTDRATVVVAGAAVAAPCSDARSARTSRDRTGIVCEGIAYAWIDGRWIPLVTDALALDAEAGTIVAAHTSASCPGGAAVTRFTGTDGVDLGCVSGVDPSAPVALSVLDSEILLWSGDRVRGFD